MLKNGNFTFLLLETILAYQLTDLPAPLVVKNGDFTFLLLEIILADLPLEVVKNGDFTLLLLELILEDAVTDLLADLPSSSGI